ncbi:hypothetical protein LCM4579_26025 [Ensifer sp. LCM 4579]|nr:hypothetical protein LCM4579_26025 [Ensifer sp. LCM 4579]
MEAPALALLIYSADSYVGYCNVLYEYLVAARWKVEIIEVTETANKPTLSEQQRTKWGVSFPPQIVRRITESELVNKIVGSNAGFIFLGIPGRKVFYLCNTLDRYFQLNPGTTITTGFPGLQYYMKFSGLFWRSFVDHLLFIDPTLCRLATRWLPLVPVRTANCVLLGSPRLKSIPPRKAAVYRKYIAFFEQNQVPATDPQRRELARRLASLMDSYPDRTLLIVARNQPGESSNHDAEDTKRIDRLLQLEGHSGEVFNGDWTEIVDQIEFALSVSSTALLEASLLQVPSFSIRLGSAPETQFDARRFFRRLGFERNLEELYTTCSMQPDPSAQNFLAPFNHAALFQVFRPRTVLRHKLSMFEIFTRRVCVIGARALDWIFRSIEVCRFDGKNNRRPH